MLLYKITPKVDFFKPKRIILLAFCAKCGYILQNNKIFFNFTTKNGEMLCQNLLI